MDIKIVWSPEAIEDVELIADYITRDSAAYASAVVDKILYTAKTLVDMPYTGRIVPEFNNEQIREKFVYSYRLIYQVKPKQILVITVIHGKRLLEEFILESND
jgi:toxin ParE1/3/4